MRSHDLLFPFGRRCLTLLTGLLLFVCPVLGAQTECELEWLPEKVPPLTDVLDSAAFMTGLTEWSGQFDGESVLLVVRFAQGLTYRQVDLIGTEIPVERARDLRALVVATRSSKEPAEEAWGVRLRVVLDAQPRVLVEPAGYCAPRLKTQGTAVSGRSELSIEEFQDLMRAGKMRVRVLVDATGYVVKAELRRSSSSRRQRDEVLEEARTTVYHPATIDGVPVRTIFEYDVEWTIR